jgi:ADP-heptose:LPS heptosyltransferase
MSVAPTTLESGPSSFAERRIERIAVFRALQLGDMLCAIPALRALRHAFPKAQITLIGLPWAHKFARRFAHYVDDFIAFPGAPGLRERKASAAEAAEFTLRAYAARFDLALQLHGSGRFSNPIVGTLAYECAGFYPSHAPCPDPARFMPYPEWEPEIRRLLGLLQFLGIPSQGEALEFPISTQEWREFAALRARFALAPGKYVCLHPGARAAARRWSPEGLAHVADRLAARGLQVVLTGTAEEAALTAAVAKSMHASYVNLAGQTSVGVLAALLTGAKLLICNDTAVSHMAAALRTPSVVIYLGSSPARWAPLDTRLHRQVFHSIECRPCEHEICPIGHTCAVEVTADDVMREVDVLLGPDRTRTVVPLEVTNLLVAGERPGVAVGAPPV